METQYTKTYAKLIYDSWLYLRLVHQAHGAQNKSAQNSPAATKRKNHVPAERRPR